MPNGPQSRRSRRRESVASGFMPDGSPGEESVRGRHADPETVAHNVQRYRTLGRPVATESLAMDAG